MENYNKTIKKRQLVFSLLLIFSSVVLLLSRIWGQRAMVGEHVEDFVAGFQVGIVLTLVGLLVFLVMRYRMAGKNPELMKKMYISETDERTQWIQQKAGSQGMNIVVYGLTLATAVAGNFNGTVFFTLLAADVFVLLVRLILKLYYKNKF